jgi:chromate reductase
LALVNKEDRMKNKEIAVIVGSLRKGSFNRMMAKEMIALAPSSLNFKIIEIGNLPLYNEDLESNPPEEWREFRESINGCDGVLFVTPEYNRSFSGAIKNAIDVGSRPYGKSVWEGKPSAVASVSIGQIGAFGANHHLRQTLVVLNMPCMPQPEAYFGNAQQLFDESGKLLNEGTKDFVQSFMNSFANWVEKNS